MITDIDKDKYWISEELRGEEWNDTIKEKICKEVIEKLENLHKDIGLEGIVDFNEIKENYVKTLEKSESKPEIDAYREGLFIGTFEEILKRLIINEWDANGGNFKEDDSWAYAKTKALKVFKESNEVLAEIRDINYVLSGFYLTYHRNKDKIDNIIEAYEKTFLSLNKKINWEEFRIWLEEKTEHKRGMEMALWKAAIIKFERGEIGLEYFLKQEDEELSEMFFTFGEGLKEWLKETGIITDDSKEKEPEITPYKISDNDGEDDEQKKKKKQYDWMDFFNWNYKSL